MNHLFMANGRSCITATARLGGRAHGSPLAREAGERYDGIDSVVVTCARAPHAATKREVSSMPIVSPLDTASHLATRLCVPLPASSQLAIGGATLEATPFDEVSVVMGVGTVALLVAVGVTLLVHWRRRRGTRGGRWLVALTVASLLFAALALAWIWQLRASYISGCVIYFNAAPFSQEQAFGLAPSLVIVVAGLTVLWVALAVWFALARRAGVPTEPSRRSPRGAA